MDSKATALRLIPPNGADPTPSVSDDYLMGLVVAGQTSAFNEIIRRYQPRIHRFCGLLLKSESSAADATQEVFSKLWEKRQYYRPQNRFRELLFMMARNHCRSLGRKRWLRTMLSIDDAPRVWDVAETDTDANIMERERTLITQSALNQLPDKFRIPLALRFLEGMPYEEIAQVIGRTPSAARSRIHYGLRELAILLPEEMCS